MHLALLMSTLVMPVTLAHDIERVADGCWRRSGGYESVLPVTSRGGRDIVEYRRTEAEFVWDEGDCLPVQVRIDLRAEDEPLARCIATDHGLVFVEKVTLLTLPHDHPLQIACCGYLLDFSIDPAVGESLHPAASTLQSRRLVIGQLAHDARVMASRPMFNHYLNWGSVAGLR